jgi:hypothetical protein
MLCCKGDTPSKYPSENSPSPALLRGSVNKTKLCTYQLAETICQTICQLSGAVLKGKWTAKGQSDFQRNASMCR